MPETLLQLAEAEAHLKQQQATYEQVRTDRNLCSRNLLAAQDEVLELRNRSKILVRPLAYYLCQKLICFRLRDIQHTTVDIPIPCT